MDFELLLKVFWMFVIPLRDAEEECFAPHLLLTLLAARVPQVFEYVLTKYSFLDVKSPCSS